MINLKALNGHRFILVAIDYFTKWVKATSFAILTKKHVLRFFAAQHHFKIQITLDHHC